MQGPHLRGSYNTFVLDHKYSEKFMSSSFIGKVVDNYRIIENLGIGGMGVVFKAIHIKLDKIFALKMIAPGLAMNENFIKRFQIEAKALAKFEDPNIVRIYDLRSEGDQWFIVMEYVDGFNLLDLIRKDGAFPLQNALSIIKKMLTAIGHAHRAGIIHRDIKPNNVMITTAGKVKITDFGLAKDQSSGTTTLTVTSGGTLYYMSPEHVKGFQFTDKRSDIYSIGMTFYEMITGTVPFKDLQSDFDIRESIIRKKIKKPTFYNKNIPPDLESIVMKSISKEPNDRYQSPEEMLKAILEFEAQDPNIDSKFALVEIPEDSSKKISVQKSAKERVLAVLSIFKDHIQKKNRTLIRIGVFGSLMIALFLLIYFFSFNASDIEDEPDLIAEISHISISSQPSSAYVIIGNDSIGQTPIINHSVQSGEYFLKLNKANYASIDTNIVLEPGNQLNMAFSLQPDGVIKSTTTLRNQSVSNTNMRQDMIKPAKVTVNSEPSNAEVHLNGKFKGKTPLNITDLSPGNYRVKVIKEDFEGYEKRLKLISGQNKAYLAKLSPTTGGIRISTEPPSAQVLIDGIEISDTKTPVQLDKIAIGKHTIEIQKKGFETITREIEIKADKITENNFQLIQLEGKLSISVRPWGSIYINDELKKESADTKYDITLPAMQHKLTVTHPTFGKWEKTIQIESNNETEVLVNFNRKINLNIVAFDENGSPLAAEIIIDNKNTGESTPAEIVTREGLHTLTVKKEGYITSNHKDEIFVDKNTNNQHKIILKKIE